MQKNIFVQGRYNQIYLVLSWLQEYATTWYKFIGDKQEIQAGLCSLDWAKCIKQQRVPNSTLSQYHGKY